MERGGLRFVLLDALRDEPKHGYDIIKGLEEHTQVRYSPSPGVGCPTLQIMNDERLVTDEQQRDRGVYRLSDAGREELETRADRIEAF